MFCETVAIIGVGLLGGSLGLAVRQRGLARRVVGVVRRAEAISDVLKQGIVTEATVEIAEAVRQADLVLVCTPVDCIAKHVCQAFRYAPSHAVLTDVGSTKARLVAEVEASWLQMRSSGGAEAFSAAECRFVGSHPLAGSEKSGYEHAQAQLFVGRWVIVTPTPRSCPEATERLVEFWEGLGARVQLMAPEDHDQALALTSHLPHLLASALAGILPGKWADFAASGFRDTTRIASGLPEIWTPIFLHNREAVLDALQQLENRLEQFRQALQHEDREKLFRLLAEGKARRDSLNTT
ncbi:MAG: prephenate dehydrogenase/arogenate dehydrogenase family protein [Gemmatales bacterium]|nr:prephenate dehydrogenase/arogenate dehydrogenase family protein [Gemmatales bacterium]MDW7993953.1 prephenate dehydrogenase/arogenate dehydrogenase family protein [Gemmatales bacterium]